MSPAEKVRTLIVEDSDEGKEPDLSGRALFCQMDVLCHASDGTFGWKQAARYRHCQSC